MQTLLDIVVGVIYAASIYLMLRRSSVQLALGLASGTRATS